MDSEFSKEEILKNFVDLNNVDDLFDSDILILPYNTSGIFIFSQPLDIKKECKNLNVKYYSENQEKLRYIFTDSYSELIELGVMAISTISGLITIADFLNKRYGNNPQINIQLFNKTVNNTYIYHDYKGDVYNFNHEIEKMEDDFKHNGP